MKIHRLLWVVVICIGFCVLMYCAFANASKRLKDVCIKNVLMKDICVLIDDDDSFTCRLVQHVMKKLRQIDPKFIDVS